MQSLLKGKKKERRETEGELGGVLSEVAVEAVEVDVTQTRVDSI